MDTLSEVSDPACLLQLACKQCLLKKSTHLYTRAHTHIHTHTHTHVNTHTRTRTHTLAHTHTHTYTCRCKPRCQPVAWCAVPQRTKPQGQECKQHPQACCPPPCGCCSSSAVDAAWHMHVAACRGRVCVVTLANRCCARTGAHGPLLKVGW
jgi:hypothetical protein